MNAFVPRADQLLSDLPDAAFRNLPARLWTCTQRVTLALNFR
jgi:hypothetical protein